MRYLSSNEEIKGRKCFWGPRIFIQTVIQFCGGFFSPLWKIWSFTKGRENNELLCNHHSASTVIKFYYSSFSRYCSFFFPGVFSPVFKANPQNHVSWPEVVQYVSLTEMDIFHSCHAITIFSKLTVITILTVWFSIHILIAPVVSEMPFYCWQ